MNGPDEGSFSIPSTLSLKQIAQHDLAETKHHEDNGATMGWSWSMVSRSTSPGSSLMTSFQPAAVRWFVGARVGDDGVDEIADGVDFRGDGVGDVGAHLLVE